MNFRSSFLKTLITLASLIVLQASANEDYPIVWGSHSVQGIEQHPPLVVEGQEFELHFVGFHLTDGDGLARPIPEDYYEISIDGNHIELNISGRNSICISPTPPGYIPDAPQRKILPIPGLPAGTYTVTADIDAFCTSNGRPERQVTVYPKVDSLLFNAESPAKLQIVSGVGVIRGWACYEKTLGYGPATGDMVGRVAYQIDDGEITDLPYGSTRTDTETVCGNNNVNTGYAGVTYWGHYGEGEHKFTLYVDGQSVYTNGFIVAAPNAGFMKGLQEERIIENFPEPGKNVVIRWSESDQNFIIVEYD